ncbi:hypothetical protein CRYUN_Cryun38cG0025200 [Craigia yunnanensis]
MATKASSASTVFLLSFNLLFFTLVSSQTPTCSRPNQDLGVCEAELTRAFFGVSPNPNGECCSRFDGLSDLETAVCMCDILKANASRIPVSLNTVLRIFLSYCDRNPNIYNCA